MDFLLIDWLGTPLWFWLAFLGLVVALTAFDLGILHKENREMGISESLRLSAMYIGIAIMFGGWIWAAKGGERGASSASQGRRRMSITPSLPTARPCPARPSRSASSAGDRPVDGTG